MSGHLSNADGLSDYALTGGTWADALMCGIPVETVHEAWLSSATPLEFEAKCHASIALRFACLAAAESRKREG